MTRTIKIVITLSFMLNIILMSALGVSYVKKKIEKDQPVPINKQARQKIKDRISQASPEVRKNMKQVREKTKALKDIIAAPNFDKESYNQTVSELLDLRDNAARERARKMGEAMADIPPEERKKLSRGLMRHHDKDRKRPALNK